MTVEPTVAAPLVRIVAGGIYHATMSILGRKPGV